MTNSKISAVLLTQSLKVGSLQLLLLCGCGCYCSNMSSLAVQLLNEVPVCKSDGHKPVNGPVFPLHVKREPLLW